MHPQVSEIESAAEDRGQQDEGREFQVRSVVDRIVKESVENHGGDGW